MGLEVATYGVSRPNGADVLHDRRSTERSAHLAIQLPSDPEQLGAVQFAINRDNLTVSANNITVPATFYVALSYANRGAVAQALLNNVEIRGSGAAGDEARFGAFQLTADEE